MKRFVVDFEGEEDAEAEPDPYLAAPKYIVFWWDSKPSAILDCKNLYIAGVPVQVVKYMFGPGYALAGEIGWGAGVDIGYVSNPETEGRAQLRYYRIDIDHRHGTSRDFKFVRSCWLYEEIAHMLAFFEAIPYNPEVVV